MKIIYIFLVLLLMSTIESYSQYALYAWGNNAFYRLGDGTSNEMSTPNPITHDQDWTQIAEGGAQTFALKADGSLWAWGDNSGKYGDGSIADSHIPTRIGFENDWAKITTSSNHSLAIKTDGSLWAWGNNDFGQLGNGSNISSFIPVQINPGSNWKLAACSRIHTVAIKTDGTLWAWGNNIQGQLGNGNYSNSYLPIQIGTEKDWSYIACGSNHTLAIKTNGTLWAWGENSSGQMGDSVVSGTNIPIQIGSANNWASISCFAAHSLAIKKDGTLWAWGHNNFGQLGDEIPNQIKHPTQIGSDNQWSIVSTTYRNTFAIKKDGSLWAWGNNQDLQLGDGTRIFRGSPIQIGTNKLWTDIAAGQQHTFALYNSNILISPRNLTNRISASIDLKWHKFNNCSSYRVQVATDSNFSTLIKNETTTDSNYMIAGLIHSTEYFWRVCGYIEKDSTEWTGAWKFYTSSQNFRTFVNANAVGLNDGSSWSNAFTSLQNAIDIAFPGDTIWIAKGTYITNNSESNDRKFSFRMKQGVSIYGGFEGTENSITQRNIELNPTILSGDIGIIGNNTDNIYHVISFSDSLEMDNSTLLDGLTISNGYANLDSIDGKGGALILYKNGSPLFRNCTFSNNYSQNAGGAIYIVNSSPRFEYCKFINNCNDTDSEIDSGGGAIYADFAKDIIINNCTFADNKSRYGGALNFELSDYIIINNSKFENNSSSSIAGATYFQFGSSAIRNSEFNSNKSDLECGANFYNNGLHKLSNCKYTNNKAIEQGGALKLSSGNYYISNCTISGNSAKQGGGIYLDSNYSKIQNTIVWNNSASASGNEIYKNLNAKAKIYNSCYRNQENDLVGTIDTTANNIFLDPQFVKPENNDYRIVGNSPCVDAGNDEYSTDSTDIRGAGFLRKLSGTFLNTVGTIDIGAYEYNMAKDPTSSVSNEILTDNSDVSISPQPVINDAIITFNTNVDTEIIVVELYDIKGTLIKSYQSVVLQNNLNQLHLDVSYLSNGIYNMIIKSGANIYQSKLVKVK